MLKYYENLDVTKDASQSDIKKTIVVKRWNFTQIGLMLTRVRDGNLKQVPLPATEF